MAVTWAKELARQGIRCIAIAPSIGTEMVLNMKPEALEKIAAGIPARRLGRPVAKPLNSSLRTTTSTVA